MASLPPLILNGIPRALDDLDPDTTALDWIRAHGLVGAKEGCAEGECGACAILVLRPAVAIDLDDGSPTESPDAGERSLWTAVNACLVPVASLAGQEVLTCEGLGSPADLHPAQQAMAVAGGSQCGYCTPGFVVAMAAEYYRPNRSEDVGAVDGVDQAHSLAHRDAGQVETLTVAPARSEGSGSVDGESGPNGFDLHALSGNLCRCTGYRPIRDAAYGLQAPASTDPIAARQHRASPACHVGRLEGPRGTFLRPGSLDEALTILREHPDADIVAGSTDRGVEVNLRGLRSRLVLGIDRVPQLREFRVNADAIELGAALTLTEIERGLAGRVPVLDELFVQFASRLIRNSATLGGNLGTASPIGDSPPVLLALGASIVLASLGGEREVATEDFFTGYRRTERRRDELIRSVRIPIPTPQLTAFHKIAKRRFDDISSVAVGFGLDVVNGVVMAARIGLGGVAATPLRARATETALVGGPWSRQAVEAAAQLLSLEGTPLDDHRASAAYRSAMLGQALRKLHAHHPEPTARPQEVLR